MPQVTEEQFRVPHCTRCVDSGENTPDECRLVAISSASECAAIAGLQDKVHDRARPSSTAAVTASLFGAASQKAGTAAQIL